MRFAKIASLVALPYTTPGEPICLQHRLSGAVSFLHHGGLHDNAEQLPMTIRGRVLLFSGGGSSRMMTLSSLVAVA